MVFTKMEGQKHFFPSPHYFSGQEEPNISSWDDGSSVDGSAADAARNEYLMNAQDGRRGLPGGHLPAPWHFQIDRRHNKGQHCQGQREDRGISRQCSRILRFVVFIC